MTILVRYANEGDSASSLIDWLVTETNVEALDEIANRLADIGPSIIQPVMISLNGNPTRDQADVLLKALGWLDVPEGVSLFDPEISTAIIERYLMDKEADVRAAACAATRILARDRRVALLADRRNAETDPYVLEAIEESEQETK